MKPLHLLWLLLLAPTALFAQGYINFANLGAGVNAPITNTATWQRVPAGNTFLAQLYYGPAGSAANLVNLQPFYVQPLPEPATAWLGLLGTGVLVCWRMRRR